MLTITLPLGFPQSKRTLSDFVCTHRKAGRSKFYSRGSYFISLENHQNSSVLQFIVVVNSSICEKSVSLVVKNLTVWIVPLVVGVTVKRSILQFNAANEFLLVHKRFNYIYSHFPQTVFRGNVMTIENSYLEGWLEKTAIGGKRVFFIFFGVRIYSRFYNNLNKGHSYCNMRDLRVLTSNYIPVSFLVSTELFELITDFWNKIRFKLN